MTTDRYVSPIDDRSRPVVPPAPRLEALDGASIALVDISKYRGAELLDRLEDLLVGRYGVGEVTRLVKPTYSRPAPGDVLAEAERSGAVILALAD